MSGLNISSANKINLTESTTKVATKVKEETSEVKASSALQTKDSAAPTSKVGSVPQVSVLDGAKAGAKTGAKIGSVGGLIAGAVTGVALGSLAYVITGGSSKVGYSVAAALTVMGAGFGAASGAVKGGAIGAVSTKMSHGNVENAKKSGALAGGVMAAGSFKDGIVPGIVGTAIGAIEGAHIAKKAVEANK